MLAFGLALYFDLEHPYWAISTVYIVTTPLSGTSASKGAYRLVGTVIGGIMTVVMVPLLVNSPELLSAAIIVWVSLCAYVSQLDRTPRGYLFQLAGYTVLLAGLPIVETPGDVFPMAVSRVEEIGLAIICAILVNQIIFPSHVGPVVTKQITAWRENCKALALDVFKGDQMDVEKTRREWQTLTGGIVSMRELVAHVAYDASHHQALVKLLSGIQDRMRLLPPVLSAIEDHVMQIGFHPDAQHPELAALLADVEAWVREGRCVDAAETSSLSAKAQHLEESALAEVGSGLLVSSLAQRVGLFIKVWHECSVLHDDLCRGMVSPRSEQFLSQAPRIRVFRDHGQAVLAACATALAIAAPMAFWIGSGWSAGMLITQISGVFCCRWIGMDNPAFLLRKTVTALVLTAVVSLALNFTVLTSISDFASLVAVLGLVMLPVGAMRKTPGQRITSMLFCIFLPLMVNLHDRISLDFSRMVMTDVGLVLGVFCCLVIITLVKTAGAETRSFYLLRAGWRIVANVAGSSSPNHDRKLQRLLDLVSLWASRQVAIAADSRVRQYDLLRDLRLGKNLDRLQELASDASTGVRNSVTALCHEMAGFYRKGQPLEDRGAVLTSLQQCWTHIFQDDGRANHRRMLALLLSIQVCIAPVHSALPEQGMLLKPLQEV